LWALVAVAIVGAGVLLLLHRPDAKPAQVSAKQVTFGGSFQLTDAEGQPFSSNKLAGRPYATFFGFTHCPDVCPTTLARLVRLRHQLNQGSEPFQIVFVTVDPERDRPAELKTYLSLFKEPIIGLTGTQPQIDQAKRQFGIYSAKVPDEAGGYTVDHTATVLMFDGKGGFVATVSPEESDAVALAKLKRISAAE
jgi:protein SCO1/2